MIKPIYFIFFICVFSLVLWFCIGREDPFKSLTSAQFEELIKNPDVQVVDVRTLAEHMEGHIPGSLNINIKDEEGFPIAVDSLLDKNHDVAVYCKGGVRSRKAAKLLVKKGFVVYNLNKGFQNWAEEGREIEK